MFASNEWYRKILHIEEDVSEMKIIRQHSFQCRKTRVELKIFELIMD